MINDFGIAVNYIDIGDLPWCEIDFPEDYNMQDQYLKPTEQDLDKPILRVDCL